MRDTGMAKVLRVFAPDFPSQRRYPVHLERLLEMLRRWQNLLLNETFCGQSTKREAVVGAAGTSDVPASAPTGCAEPAYQRRRELVANRIQGVEYLRFTGSEQTTKFSAGGKLYHCFIKVSVLNSRRCLAYSKAFPLLKCRKNLECRYDPLFNKPKKENFMSSFAHYAFSVSLFVAIPAGVQWLVSKLSARRALLAASENALVPRKIVD